MKPTRKTLVIGVAGIMGAGKSTVAKVFEELGAKRLDADHLGKEMLSDSKIRDALLEAFGPEIRGTGGEIDPASLGRRAFESPEEAQKLDEITREPLIARIRAAIEELRPTSDIIVIDAALLPEWNAKPWLDVLVVVDSDEARSAARMEAASRFTESDVRSRMRHQLDRTKKAACADVVIPNYGSLEDLKARAKSVFWTLVSAEGKSFPG